MNLIGLIHSVLLILILTPNGISQKNAIGVNLGFVFGDGLVLSAQSLPSIGIEYNHFLTRNIKINFLLSNYKTTYAESYVINASAPILENNKNRNHPFVTISELEKLSSTGILKNKYYQTIYQTNIPLEIGLDVVIPFFNKHAFNLGVATGFLYSNFNHPRDQIPGEFEVDGTIHLVTLLLNTEYRRFNTFFSPRVGYTYNFRSYYLGLEAKNYNFFISNDPLNPIIWNTNIKIGYRF